MICFGALFDKCQPHQRLSADAVVGGAVRIQVLQALLDGLLDFRTVGRQSDRGRKRREHDSAECRESD